LKPTGDWEVILRFRETSIFYFGLLASIPFESKPETPASHEIHEPITLIIIAILVFLGKLQQKISFRNLYICFPFDHECDP
jgi:hypothetical protein